MVHGAFHKEGITIIIPISQVEKPRLGEDVKVLFKVTGTEGGRSQALKSLALLIPLGVLSSTLYGRTAPGHILRITAPTGSWTQLLLPGTPAFGTP